MNPLDKQLSPDAQMGAHGAGDNSQNEEKEIDPETGYTVMFFDSLDRDALYDEANQDLYVRDGNGDLWKVTDHDAAAPDTFEHAQTGATATFAELFEAPADEPAPEPEGGPDPEGSDSEAEPDSELETTEQLPAKYTENLDEMQENGLTIYQNQEDELFVFVGSAPYVIHEAEDGKLTYEHYETGEKLTEETLRERMSDEELLEKYSRGPISQIEDKFAKVIFENADGHQFIVVDDVYYDVKFDDEGVRYFSHWKNGTRHTLSQLMPDDKDVKLAAYNPDDNDPLVRKVNKDGTVSIVRLSKMKDANKALGDQDDRQTF